MNELFGAILYNLQILLCDLSWFKENRWNNKFSKNNHNFNLLFTPIFHFIMSKSIELKFSKNYVSQAKA